MVHDRRVSRCLQLLLLLVLRSMVSQVHLKPHRPDMTQQNSATWTQEAFLVLTSELAQPPHYKL